MRVVPTSFLTIVLAASLTGCTTSRQTFASQTNDEIWAAMIETAREPDYNDPDYTKRWTLRENQVWVDEQEDRIEIYRRVERVLTRPLSHDLHQQREWRFAVTLERSDEPKDREVKFVSRGPGVPGHAKYEADRFFIQVREALGQNPRARMAEQAAAATQPHPANPEAPPMQGERR